MQSGIIAGVAALIVLGFVEGLRRYYPARSTWLRLATARGRPALQVMRERFEQASESTMPRTVAIALLLLVGLWIGLSEFLDKRWYEIALDSLPYPIVALALWRTPGTLKKIADRMKRYEEDAHKGLMSDDAAGPLS